MKSIKRILPLLLPLLFITACGGNDEPKNNQSEMQQMCERLKSNIVGTWYLKSTYNSSSSNPYVGLGWQDANNQKLIFYADGTAEEYIGINAATSTTPTYKFDSYTIRVVGPNYTNISHLIDSYPYEPYMLLLELPYSNSGNSLGYLVNYTYDGSLYLYHSFTGSPQYLFKK